MLSDNEVYDLFVSRFMTRKEAVAVYCQGGSSMLIDYRRRLGELTDYYIDSHTVLSVAELDALFGESVE